MSTKRRRSPLASAKEAKALRDRLLKDQEYLTQLDEALEEFKDGKGKALEEIESVRRLRRPKSSE